MIRFINVIRNKFYDRDGVLYTRRGNKPAGSIGSGGYLNIRVDIDGKRNNWKAHRVMWLLYNDSIPDVLDHIDRNKLNNAIINLRESNPEENARNKGEYSNNTSGMSGVSPRGNEWRVRHNCNHIGYYDTFEEACTIKTIPYGELKNVCTSNENR